MPTYQYRCKDCAELTEAVQKFTDPALTECPSCGGTLAKVYNAVGVVFKGSGFYKTDSRSSAKPAASSGSASDAAAPNSSTKAATSSDSSTSSGASTTGSGTPGGAGSSKSSAGSSTSGSGTS